MANTTLIIKTGAAGDVVRTTSLLQKLEGEVFWLTTGRNRQLLPDDREGLVSFTLEEAPGIVNKLRFSHVISLEEDEDCAALASSVKTDQLTGVYLVEKGVTYTNDSSGWFDMSRISRFGRAEANRLKLQNERSYQEHIFFMTGHSFNGEPYWIFRDKDLVSENYLIGIEQRSGERWPNKQWGGYSSLMQRLMEEGRPIRNFSQQENLRDYLRDIAGCTHIVSGDSLAMHVALAYGKTCTAIFNCTSPAEIYDYGLLKKMVSPLLAKNFYSTTYDPEVIHSIPVEDVYRSIPDPVR